MVEVASLKKTMLIKDFFMEIRKAPSRFLSIFLIVTLGVAFFSGIRSTEPDMTLTADEFYDSHNFTDIRIQGTLGLTEEDLAAVSSLEDVKWAVGGKSADLLAQYNDALLNFKVIADLGDKNKIDVTEGRMPEKVGECLIDAGTMTDYGYQIGDSISFLSPDDSDLSDTLCQDSYTIVGIGSSPEYISYSRGSTTIGDGSLDAFVIVTPEAFSLDVYTYIDVASVKAESAIVYSDAYDEAVSDLKKTIEDTLSDERCQIRYTSVVDEAQSKIDDAQEELDQASADAKSKLSDALTELEDGEKQYQDGLDQIEENEKKLADAYQQLTDAQTQLEDGQAQLNEGASQLQSGWSQYYAGLNEYHQNVQNLAASRSQVESGLTAIQNYESAMQQIEDSLTAINQAKAALAQLPEGASLPDGSSMESLLAQEASLNEQKASLEENASSLPDKTSLQASLAQIEAGESQLAVAKESLDASYEQLSNSQATLDASQAEIDANAATLAEGLEEYQSGKLQLEEGKAKLSDSRSQLDEGWTEYEDGKEEAESEIADAQAQLDDAQDELDDIEYPKWYVSDRSGFTSYSELGDNALRMGAIGTVFPVLFFLIAALISLTTMTRMVGEQRVQIGTMKALGYSNHDVAFKYIAYALSASVSGSLVGVLLGEKFFPWIIITAYKIMYPHLDTLVIPYNLPCALLAGLAAIACVSIATIYSCFHELAETPASLMRPLSPANGKRILLERIGFFWKRLSFSRKSTLRNLFRYKKRFLMTVLGIGGCMAMMILGYGLKDSIGDITDIQYNDLQTYDSMIVLNDNATEADWKSLYSKAASTDSIDETLSIQMTSMDAGEEADSISTYLIVPQDLSSLSDFYTFRSRKGHEAYQLDDSGAIISEKMAKKLNLAPGDTLTLSNEDKEQYSLRVSAVCENYLGNYVYVTPDYYQECFGEASSPNVLLASLQNSSKSEEDALAESFLKEDYVINISFVDDLRSQMDDILDMLDTIVLVLIASAGLLAFIVLYNLNNINITERRRELATLKVLGFFDREVAAYVYRENVLLTIFGMIIGLFLGKLLHTYIITTVEIDSAMFGRTIKLMSYVHGLFWTALFAIVVNLVMYFKLKLIDMVESLKSVE